MASQSQDRPGIAKSAGSSDSAEEKRVVSEQIISHTIAPLTQRSAEKKLSRRQEAFREMLANVGEKAIKTVDGLFDGSNHDADATWQNCTTRTRAALILTQAMAAAERQQNKNRGGADFGLLVITDKMDADKWEKFARSGRDIIDVDAAPVDDEPERD